MKLFQNARNCRNLRERKNHSERSLPMQELTDQQKAEQQLKQSELFYRNLIADSLDGVLLTSKEGIISFVSPSVTKILGHHADDIMGKSAFSFVHPEDRETGITAFQEEVNMEPQVRFINIRLQKKDGDYLWCIVRGHNLMNNPYVGRMVIYFTDDTNRKVIEDRLRDSEKKFRTLIYSLHQGVVLQNEKTQVVLHNPAALQILGVNEQQLMSTNSYDVRWKMINEDGSECSAEDHPAPIVIRTKKEVRDMVLGVNRGDNQARVWLLVSAAPILDSNGNIQNVITSFTDITEQKRLSQELIDQEIHRQRLLTQATIDGQEKERQEIGKELHDNINQHLTTTRLYLEVAREKATGEVLEMIRLAHKNLADIVNEIRNLSQSLVPPTLGDLGLVESIHELCDALKRAHSFQVEFHHRHFTEEALPANLKLMIFRIIQEQVSNIIRHAHASLMHIRLQSDAEYVILDIHDNGKGFDLSHFKKGMGLSNIANRADLFDGKVDINTAPGKGCTITVTIPQPAAHDLTSGKD